MRKFLYLVLFLYLITGCTNKESTIEVSSVSLNTATIEMVEGETFSLVATVLPKDAEYDKVIWASSNASVARVNSGTVTAIKEGTATITASAGGKSSTCIVKVSTKVVSVTSITLDKTSLSMKVGETETITATVNPDNATDKSVTWGSSDVSVATVADGRVTAKKSGTAIITAKSGSCIAECTVNISVDVESVTLDKTTLSLTVGETATLTATVKPDDATDKNVTWTSSDESVSKVADGKVTAVKSGKATITAKCEDKTAECAVTVTVPTGSVTLDKTSLSLAVGETAQLTATVKPDDATDKTVVWTSSDESVAEVINGKVTALKSGTTTITARCGGKSAECIVTVIVPVSSVNLDRNDLMLPVGDAATLIVKVKPDNATSKNVAWSSSNESVATVKNGNVVAVKEGEAIISASVGNISASCKVVVINTNRVIKYTAKSVVTPFNQDAFGAKIISNEYSYPNGMIIFDAPVAEIGRNAFYKCHTLWTIVVPESVSAIGDNAFCDCENLSSINLPESVASIGIAAFRQCYTLSDIVLPNMVTTIEKDTFYSCWNLSKVVFPKDLKTIGEWAFHYTKIKTLDLPNGLQSIERFAFSGCLNITNLIIPDSVVSIGIHAFRECRSLLSVEIHEGVTVLNESCFEECSLLSTVKLPNSINKIDGWVFNECPVLSNLYLKASMPPEISRHNVFGVNSCMNIWVPRASVDAYKEKWTEFKDNIKAYDF